MIHCPKTAFDEETFLARVKELYEQKHGMVATSKSLRYEDGEQIVEAVSTIGRDTYSDDSSAPIPLFNIKKLSIKSRNEKLGILDRSLSARLSTLERTKANKSGREAIKPILSGMHTYMTAIEMINIDPYKSQNISISIDEEVITTRILLDSNIDAEHFDIDPTYETWLYPWANRDLGYSISFLKQGGI